MELPNHQIINADCLEVLSNMNDEIVDLTFTSPPYFNAREYSQYDSYQDYISFLTNVFREVHRITKEGRFFVLNISPVITPRISRSHQSVRHAIPFDLHPHLSNIGWDFIDDIIWIKPEASVKNRNAQFSRHRIPLTYKPNVVTEYILVYRKHTDKLIDWNIKKYKNTNNMSIVSEFNDSTNIWYISPRSSKLHPAIFPDSLCEKVIQYYSFKNDIVLDPFAGIGTCCKVAQRLNRRYIGIEKNKDYFNKINFK